MIPKDHATRLQTSAPRVWRPFPREHPRVVCVYRPNANVRAQMREQWTVSLLRAGSIVKIESARVTTLKEDSILIIPPRVLHALVGHQTRCHGSLVVLVSEDYLPSLRPAPGVLIVGAGPTPNGRRARATPLLPIRDYLRSRISVPVSVERLVRLSGLTEFHLIRAFRREFGLPPHAYHLRLRLARACTLLSSGNTVSRTAYECGFADHSHLSRTFKDVYGLTPAAWIAGTLVSLPARRASSQ